MTTPPDASAAYPAAPPEPLPSEEPWRRLDRRMLLVAPVQELGRGLIPIVVILFTGFGDPIRTGITAAGALLLIVWGVVRYLTTTYRVTPQQVQLRRGVLNRSTLVAPRDRVRSVDVTSPFLHRLLGLGKVVIGTGKTESRKGREFALDGLGVADAQRLRTDLLQRSPVAAAADGVDLVKDAVPRETAPEHELVRLRPRWVFYAPFTLSGVITGLVIVGFGSRLFNEARIDPTRFSLTREVVRALQRASVVVDVLVGVVVVLVLVSLLSMVGYVLAFHRFRLVRRPDGTLHVSRGLITKRETTLEHKRVRGVELSEPLLLRWVGGARLGAVATGLRQDRGNERTASLLVPPSPRAVDLAVGADIVDDTTALEGPLTPHGPAAGRRRLTRALIPTVVIVAVLGVLIGVGALPRGFVLLIPVLVGVALALAADRVRSLGHRIGGPLVVTRHGSLLRRRSVVAADGVIGAVVRSSPFQRRAGVVTLHLTTAAGRQAYPFTDLTTERAWEVVSEVFPAAALARPSEVHQRVSVADRT